MGNNMQKYCKMLLMTLTIFAIVSAAFADQPVITTFPLTNYSQEISAWINPNDADYAKPLLTTQAQLIHYKAFYNHYFGTLSPWNSQYIQPIFQPAKPYDLVSLEKDVIADFTNQNKPADSIGYGENYVPYPIAWIEAITNNMHIDQFQQLTYQNKNRAIAIKDLSARALPTSDPFFYDYKIGGEGYPFDYLQMSAVWVGTPLYILGETRDHAWTLVLTPDFIGWVESNGIAHASNDFIKEWQDTAKKNLAAITKTQASLVDDKGKFLQYSYVGSIFPAEKSKEHKGQTKILFPLADKNHNATTARIKLEPTQYALMPLPVTPEHLASLFATLAGRPYGWGNLYFYNDCSAELKNLFTPFGIWLPRHSSNQIHAGKIVDMTNTPPEQRITYLMANGHKLMTLVYIGGHIFLYLGNYANPNRSDQALMPMTYQDMWGLSPKPAVRRAVIGKAVFFPLLLQYPEDTSLISQAAKPLFQLSFLDEATDDTLEHQSISLKALIFS
jgi:hypothetical protein